MAEPDPNPNEPSDDGGVDHVNESEVERVLAEAADLSAQLETEIGTAKPEPDPGSMADLAAFEDTPPPPDVDAQLEQVQAMLADVSDSPADPPTPAAEEVHADPPTESADQPMSAPADWSFEPESEPPDPDEISFAVSESEPVANSGASPSPSRARRLTMKTRSLLTGAQRTASRAVSPALDHTLRAVDAVDGIFAFVRYDIRRILGWVALAVFMAAAAISAYSLKP